MYAVMKDGKYFTGDVAYPRLVEHLLWALHPGGAKVWKQKRVWAERAADRWGGVVVTLTKADLKRIENGSH